VGPIAGLDEVAKYSSLFMTVINPHVLDVCLVKGIIIFFVLMVVFLVDMYGTG
jgi:hypothetical protein